MQSAASSKGMIFKEPIVNACSEISDQEENKSQQEDDRFLGVKLLVPKINKRKMSASSKPFQAFGNKKTYFSQKKPSNFSNSSNSENLSEGSYSMQFNKSEAGVYPVYQQYPRSECSPSSPVHKGYMQYGSLYGNY